jgi:PAS domain S-box-containing protein
VEDEEAHAELIRRSFEPHTGEVELTVAGTLREARAYLADSPPDLALIDLLLPDGKGTELLPDAGEKPTFPIVIMTSHGDEEVAVEAMKAGALNYVVKSASTLGNMPQIVEGGLREWGHVVERRRAEEALQASEEHFRSLIENALDVIAVVDADGTVRYTSPAIERVLGYSPDEQVGADFFALVHPEDREWVEARIRRCFEHPGSIEFLEYRCRHRDDSVRHLEAVASCHRRSDGGRQSVLNARDVTDRKQAEEEKRKLEDQLRHSQKWQLVGTLAGGIANEFNNMLTPILGFATLAHQESPPGSKTRKRLDHVLTAANRSKELAEQLLVFSRQSEPQRTPVRLHAVVEEALKLLRSSLLPMIEVRRRLETERDAVMADPDQMRQVLVNLLTNARHAMPEGGVLEVEVTAIAAAAAERPGPAPARDGYVELVVRDTGHGMDPATKERVLEPFFTTREEGERSGLGLAVTHGIVVSHGGELTVDSEPGQGTTVRILLPRAPETAETAASLSWREA